MRPILLLLALASCASRPPELSGNERALNAAYRGRWPVACRDLRAPKEDPPLLRFTLQEAARIADVRFDRGAGPRYENYALPEPSYGPFKGETVTDRGSVYLGANDYKITDQLHLFLPPLEGTWEQSRLARDRDPDGQNAAAEVAVEGQRYDSILHLRCGRL